jgi:hypothetical protein
MPEYRRQRDAIRAQIDAINATSERVELAYRLMHLDRQLDRLLGPIEHPPGVRQRRTQLELGWSRTELEWARQVRA